MHHDAPLIFEIVNFKVTHKKFNLKFKRGFVYAVLGPNGSGKSTLLRAIDRILKPVKGTIYIDGEDIKRLSAREIAKKIACLPQSSNSTPYSTVFDVILLGRKPHISFEPTQRDLEVVEKIIEQFGLKEFAFRKINELKGGDVILRILKTLTGNLNLATIIVLHDLNLAIQFADYFIFMKNGEIYCKGDPTIIEPLLIKSVYDISVKIIEFDGRKFVINYL
jgi:iron complex transport system ATP-binding protein